MKYHRPPEPSVRRVVAGGNRLRATPPAASRPQQKKRTIHLLRNRTSLKTRDRQPLENIRIPTLVVHHEEDACWACRPYEVKNITGALTNAPIKKMILVKGGDGVTGNPCEPMHHHGFFGRQTETVDLIAAWIIKPVE